MASCGILPPHAEIGDLTGSVGSAPGPQDKPVGHEPSGSPYQYENLERLNATTEAELIRALGGLGPCPRCGGTGAIPSGWLDDGRSRDCPRCGGTGRI
jgi:hypothetical protein